MKNFIIITGMHRSGTSFLSRALNLTGVYLGELDSLMSNDWIPKKDNLRGHWEYQKLTELADLTFQKNNGSWDNIPKNIEINNKIGNEVSKFCKQLYNYPSLASGFKDPRIIFCLDSWRDYLPKHLVIVAIFRHPLKVAESLKIRNNLSYEKSLELWKDYNENLLKLLGTYHGVLVNFDWPKEKLIDEILKISKKLGLFSEIDLSDWYTEELFHSDKTFSKNYKLPKEIEIIYKKLKKRSEKNMKINLNKNHLSRNELLNIAEKSFTKIKNQGKYFKKLNDENLRKIKNVSDEIKKKNTELSKTSDELALRTKDHEKAKAELSKTSDELALRTKDHEKERKYYKELEKKIEEKSEKIKSFEKNRRKYYSSRL